MKEQGYNGRYNREYSLFNATETRNQEMDAQMTLARHGSMHFT